MLEARNPLAHELGQSECDLASQYLGAREVVRVGGVYVAIWVDVVPFTMPL